MARPIATQPLFVIGFALIAVGAGTAVAETVNAATASTVLFIRETFNLQSVLPHDQTGAILLFALGFFLMVVSLFKNS